MTDGIVTNSLFFAFDEGTNIPDDASQEVALQTTFDSQIMATAKVYAYTPNILKL